MDGAEAAAMIERSKRSSPNYSIQERRQSALNHQRTSGSRGLLERLAQSEVNVRMQEEIENHLSVRDIKRS